ncbi:site-2 protease family protein [bacterium]|nr:site-2 protease family protein [bacterium]
MNQIIMIILISALVLVHEIGHFIAARMCGVRVTRFGIGMPIGPSWKLFKWNKTTFYLHAFLFGGYVSFPDDEPESAAAENVEFSARDAFQATCDEVAQEQPESAAAENVENEDENLPSDSPELYENKTIGQKLFIVSAGVLMNIIFAIVLVIFCAIFYQKLPASAQEIYINSLSDNKTSNIAQYNIQKNDRFISINNQEIKSLYQLTFFTKNSKLFDDYAQNDLVDKNIQEIKMLNPDIEDNIKANTLLLLPDTTPEHALNVNKNVVIGLEKYKKDGTKLTKSQIELRDKVYNKKVYKTDNDITLNDLAYALSDTYKPMTIKLLRDNKEITLDNVIVNK